MDLENTLALIIAYSGESISSSMEAVEAARQGDQKAVLERMASADEALAKAHEVHTELLVREANGEKIEMSLMLIHASTHMANAEMMRNVSKCFFKQYEGGE